MKRIWHESGRFGMDDHSLEQSLLAVKYKINNLKTGTEKRLKLYPVMHMDRHAEKKNSRERKEAVLVSGCLSRCISLIFTVVPSERLICAFSENRSFCGTDDALGRYSADIG